MTKSVQCFSPQVVENARPEDRLASVGQRHYFLQDMDLKALEEGPYGFYKCVYHCS
jgi:hypothetical protein